MAIPYRRLSDWTRGRNCVTCRAQVNFPTGHAGPPRAGARKWGNLLFGYVDQFPAQHLYRVRHFDAHADLIALGHCPDGELDVTV